jgi:flagellar hook-associated protein 2
MLDSTGVVASRTDGATKSIADIGHRRDALTLRLQQVEANYRKQFQALDTLLSSMTATSTFLTEQLANLPKTSQN